MLSLLVNAVVSAAVVGLTLARGGTLASTVPVVLVGLVSLTLSIWTVFFVRARALLLVTGTALAVMTIVFSPDVTMEAVLSVVVTASFVAGIPSNNRRVANRAVIEPALVGASRSDHARRRPLVAGMHSAG